MSNKKKDIFMEIYYGIIKKEYGLCKKDCVKMMIQKRLSEHLWLDEEMCRRIYMKMGKKWK